VSTLALQEARILLALHAVTHAADFCRSGHPRLGRGPDVLRRALWFRGVVFGLVVEVGHDQPPFPSEACSLSAAYWMASTILLYPVQRQRLPEMACRISGSLGLGFLARKALAHRIMPGVQKPH